MISLIETENIFQRKAKLLYRNITSCFRSIPLVYLNDRQFYDLDQAYRQIFKIHEDFSERIENITHNLKRKRNFRRSNEKIFIVDTIIESNKYLKGTTLAIDEYYKLFDLCLESILWVDEFGSNRCKADFHTIFLQKILPSLKSLETDFYIIRFHLKSLKIDMKKNVGSRERYDDINLKRFVSKFSDAYFYENYTFKNFYSLTKLFFAKYISFRERGGNYNKWFDDLEEIFGLSESLRRFLINDSVLAFRILDLKISFWKDVVRNINTMMHGFSTNTTKKPKLPNPLHEPGIPYYRQDFGQ